MRQSPGEYALGQNYPNPFNPTTFITFELPEVAHVRLKIYNMLSQEVITLVDNDEEPGYKTALFDASSLSSGVYLYRLQMGNSTEVKKMLLVR